MSLPGNCDIGIYQGSAFEMDVQFDDENGAAEDVTSHTFFMQIRDKPGGHIYADLSVGSGITITDGPAGEIAINLTAAQTALLHTSKAEYDLFRVISTVPQAELEGDVTVGQRITVVP